MHVSQSLRFPGATGWTIALSIVAVLVTACFCVVAYRRSGYRPSVGALELLRLAIVSIGPGLFNPPEWVEGNHPEEKTTLSLPPDPPPPPDTPPPLPPPP